MRTYEKEKAVKALKNFLDSTNKQIESIINWRKRSYLEEKAVKSAEKFFAQHTITK